MITSIPRKGTETISSVSSIAIKALTVDNIYSPQGDGNKFTKSISPSFGNVVDNIYSPQGDGKDRTNPIGIAHMSYLFVSEQGASIGIRGGRIEVKNKDDILRSIPVETLETIQIFGHVNVTTQCLTACLEKGIVLNYYSTNGRYYGRLVSPCHVNVERQRMQALIGEDRGFCLAFSKSIIRAKIQNQKVILRRYARLAG